MTISTQRKRIGDFMVQKGLIRREWVDRILEYAKKENLRFGEATVALGYVKREDLERVLKSRYRNEEFFHVDPAFFPQTTKSVLPLEVILREGVLPLGSKKTFHWFRPVTRLNLGMLNPARAFDAKAWIGDGALKSVEPKKYQLLPDEFLRVLIDVYGQTVEGLLKRETGEIEEGLMLYLQLDKRGK